MGDMGEWGGDLDLKTTRGGLHPTDQRVLEAGLVATDGHAYTCSP